MSELPQLPTLEPPSRPWWRRPLPWVLAVLVGLDIVLLIAALSLANVTAEGPAKRSLEHGVAALTEVDGYLSTHYEAFREQASTTSERTIAPPDFPVAVSFTPEEMTSSSPEEFRALLLQRSAEKLYSDGMASFGKREAGRDVSGEQALRAWMDFLRSDPHRVLFWLTIGLAVAAAVLAVALALSSRSSRSLAGLGVAVFVASGALLIAAIGLRFAFRLAADNAEDPFLEDYLRLAQELSWAPIRNGIIFTAGGAILAVLGGSLALWESRRTA